MFLNITFNHLNSFVYYSNAHSSLNQTMELRIAILKIRVRQKWDFNLAFIFSQVLILSFWFLTRLAHNLVHHKDTYFLNLTATNLTFLSYEISLYPKIHSTIVNHSTNSLGLSFPSNSRISTLNSLELIEGLRPPFDHMWGSSSLEDLKDFATYFTFILMGRSGGTYFGLLGLFQNVNQWPSQIFILMFKFLVRKGNILEILHKYFEFLLYRHICTHGLLIRKKRCVWGCLSGWDVFGKGGTCVDWLNEFGWIKICIGLVQARDET